MNHQLRRAARPGPSYGYKRKEMTGTMSYHALSLTSVTSIHLQSGLSLKGVLENIPSDPASIFVYLLVAFSVALIILGSWKKGRGPDGPKS